MEPTTEAVQNFNSVEADQTTVNAAALKLQSMMDSPPPEDEDSPVIEEPTEEVVEEATDEATTDEVDTSEEPVESEDVVTHFNELAEHLGVEEEFLDNLIVPTKVNGVEGKATIKDLISSYQKGESADQKFMELAEKRKAQDAELEQAKTALQQEWQTIQTMNAELQSLMGTDDDATLQELRYSDPAEYAARMAERGAKAEKLRAVQSRLQQEQQQKANEQYQRLLTVEKQKLLQAIPEWADEKTAERETVELRNYLKSQGVADNEIDGQFDSQGNLIAPGIVDHRLFVLAKKAMLFDQSRKATEPKMKKMKTLPKVGSGKPRSKGEIDQVKAQKMRQQAKQSGSVADAARIIQQIMES